MAEPPPSNVGGSKNWSVKTVNCRTATKVSAYLGQEGEVTPLEKRTPLENFLWGEYRARPV